MKALEAVMVLALLLVSGPVMAEDMDYQMYDKDLDVMALSSTNSDESTICGYGAFFVGDSLRKELQKTIPLYKGRNLQQRGVGLILNVSVMGVQDGVVECYASVTWMHTDPAGNAKSFAKANVHYTAVQKDGKVFATYKQIGDYTDHRIVDTDIYTNLYAPYNVSSPY